MTFNSYKLNFKIPHNLLNYGVKKELLDRYDVTELLEKNHLTVQQIVGDLKI